MLNSYSLKNKTVVLTGANGQLGQSLASALLSQGAFVYLTDLHNEIDKDVEVSLALQHQIEEDLRIEFREELDKARKAELEIRKLPMRAMYSWCKPMAIIASNG